METNDTQLEPMELVSIDLMKPFPETTAGNKYLVACFTRWGEVKAVSNINMEAIVEWLKRDIFPVHTIYLAIEIILDRGANMESYLLKDFCKDMCVSVRYIIAYHHQSDPVDGMNRTVFNLLRIYVNKN